MAVWGTSREAHDAAVQLGMQWAADDVAGSEDQPTVSDGGMWLRLLMADGGVTGTSLHGNIVTAVGEVVEWVDGIDPYSLAALVLTHFAVTLTHQRDIDPQWPELSQVRSLTNVVVTPHTAAMVEVEYAHTVEDGVTLPELYAQPLGVDGLARTPYIGFVDAMVTALPMSARHAAKARLDASRDGDGR